MGNQRGKTCDCCYKSYKCGPSVFQTGVQNMFPSSWAVNQLNPNGSKAVICGYPGLASYVLFKKSADAMSAFLGKYIKNVGFDGIYLDGYERPTVYQSVFNSSVKNIAQFDVNGDGQPDTLKQATDQYETWANYFVFQLRTLSGPNGVILANSAGAVSVPMLNGLTIEMESCMSTGPCTDALVAQNAMASSPGMSVMWLTHSEAMPPQQQCQRVYELQKQFPWIYAGTDFFDLSHVVCNYTMF